MDFNRFMPCKINRHSLAKSILCLLLIFFGSVEVLCAETPDVNTTQWQKWYGNYTENQFAIQVPLTTKNFGKLKHRLQIYSYLLIYLPVNNLDNNGMFRIGFFSSSAQANKLKNASDFIFDSQSIVQATPQEQQAVLSTLLIDNDSSTASNYFVFAIGPDTELQVKNTSIKVLAKAKQLYLAGRYEEAINHYRFLMIFADENTSAWANELIGLCQEKQRKSDAAVQTYSELLSSYPKYSGTKRVEQRLTALKTATSDGQASMRNASMNKQNDYQTRGIIGQYYRTLSRSVNDDEDENILATLSTDFDLRALSRWRGHSIQARLNGFSIKDNIDGAYTENRINRFFVDYQHQETGTNAILGRQKKFDSGVFTSFDGVTASYPIMDNLRIGASTGKPVYFYDVYENLDYFFYSTQIKWDISEKWILNSYYVDQTLNKVTDRKAIGIQTQFNSTKISTSLNLDYDMAFSELNNLLWFGAYNFSDRFNLSATLGQQRSPFLTATNILIGQADLDIELYLQSQGNQDSLLEDALARTSLNRYYSVAANGKINNKLRLIIDYYNSTLSNIPDNDFLLGISSISTQDSSFSQTYIGAQFILQDGFADGESFIFGLRQSTGSNSTVNQAYINEKIRFGQYWSCGAKVAYSDVKYSSSDDGQSQMRYSLQLDIRPFRTTELSIEVGNENITTLRTDTRFKSAYLFAGYRINF